MDYTNERIKVQSYQGLQKWKGRIIAHKVLYKWKNGSLFPSGTVKIYGQNPSPNRDSTNGRLEAQSHQGLPNWKDRNQVSSRTTKMEGQKQSPFRDCTHGRIEDKSYQGLHKWKGTVQMEGWKPISIRDSKNGRRMEAQPTKKGTS